MNFSRWVGFLSKFGTGRGFGKQKTLHHLALGCQDPRLLAQFYLQIPGARQLGEFLEADNSLRSVWVGFGSWTLMLEKGDREAPRALVFAWDNDWEGILKRYPIEKESKYTIYLRDPEGNLVGVSSYPNPKPRWKGLLQ